MNLLETYSHYCGVEPKNAFIDAAFYPVPFDKYIVLQNSSGMDSKNFDNWDLVVTNIKLPIIQCGGKDDKLLPNVFDLRGQTSWNQTAHIIKNASLFLGNDSVGNHMASAFNTPRIALFGATLPSTCGGAWNRASAIEINPFDRRGCESACHSNICTRGNKCINSIPVKFILENIANVIGKEYVGICDVIHVGELSKIPVLEWIPYDFNEKTMHILSQVAGLITIRHDLFNSNMFNLSTILNQFNLKYIIVAEPENIEPIMVSPDKVEQIFLKINKENVQKAIKIAIFLRNKHYKISFISELSHTDFNEFKLEMLDFPPIIRMSDFEPQDIHKSWVGEQFEIITAKRILAKDGAFFLTKYDAINNKNILEINRNSSYYILEEEHLKELQFLTLKKYA